METHPSKQIPTDYGDDKQDNLTEDKICHLLSSVSDLKVYISDDPSEACIKTLLSEASKQKSKESMKIILDFIVQQFKERFIGKYIRIWAGEEVFDPANVQTVLVCFYSGSFDTLMKSFYDLKIIYREYNLTNDEPALARACELNKKINLTPEHCDLVNEAVTKYGENLFAEHSNLEAISSSGILSSKSRGLVLETCVILYCRVKGIIPFGEKPFLKRLKVDEEISIAVDVREGYFSSHADSGNKDQVKAFRSDGTPLTEPLRMGCSVCPAGSCEGGSMGPFVQINSNKIGFLTCAHAVYSDDELLDLDITAQKEKEIVQPSDDDPNASLYHPVCGKVLHAVHCGNWSPSLTSSEEFGIDAAVIEITSRFPTAGKFLEIEESELDETGFSLSEPPKFDTGEMMTYPIDRNCQNAVIKIGSSSGLTRGLLRLQKCMVRYSQKETELENALQQTTKITMHGLMEISPQNFGGKNIFSKDGDSGAGVFLVDQDNKLTCAGLLLGALKNGNSVAIPIDKILSALRRADLQIELKHF